ncbi:PLP-dependent aminotransferase family protein [Streptomyces iconiensis]|uniref:PLP-dependent aminotransferase family protein n=1 Tax=Streptomyces iconiensis TaxID=1384038 RepID=A0ABT6ZRW5_9ACTN|nr:PLP-dependent aminotransferase family protein [Streptomyces iconiensis]MDJ1131798.1 PLP-dependent aminotransferase family protein [Streptomyces iconiensis]
MGSAELLIVLDRASGVPLQRQVVAQITALTERGRLRPGDPVPATRELARQLDVSRTVVVRAYEMLRATGVLTARHGSGTRVAPRTVPAPPVEAPPRAREPLPPLPTGAGDALWQPWEPPPSHTPGRSGIDFRHGTPALSAFPMARWQESVRRAYARADAASLGYGPAEGSGALRNHVAALVARSRSLVAGTNRVLITSGATQAMDILVRALVTGPGDVIVIEDPGHTVLRQVFGFSSATVVPVPVDGEGLRVEDIDMCVRAYGHDPARVRLVYVTPSHQFPTGVIMSAARRRALLEWAGERGATLLEDDFHNEFTFSAARLPALAADGGAETAYLGSFSKTLFPALRIGYMVLPERLVRACLGIKWITDRLSPTVDQEALADFIATGAYERHIARMSALYRRRRRHLLDELSAHFGHAGLRVSGEAAGLHVMVTLTKAQGTAENLVRAAARLGVRIYPVAGYFTHNPPAEPTFLLGYAALPEARISEGVRRLAQAAHTDPGTGSTGTGAASAGG